MSERHLFMRVLSVVPRHAVTVGSLLRGNGDRKTPEERGKLYLGFYMLNFCRDEKHKNFIGRSEKMRLTLDVSTGYSQPLCLHIEPTVLPFSKALLREYMHYATLASKLLRFTLRT